MPNCPLLGSHSLLVTNEMPSERKTGSAVPVVEMTM